MKNLLFATFALSIAIPTIAWATPVDSLVRISLETTDLSGNPISTIERGQSFLLEAIAQDLRPSGAEGIFAAYFNASYDPSLASIPQDGKFIVFPPFDSTVGGNADLTTAGIIGEAGSFVDTPFPVGSAPQPIGAVPFVATADGLLNFIASEALDLPAHYVLVFGDDSPILSSQVSYVGTSITIVPEPTSMALAALGFVGPLAFASLQRRIAEHALRTKRCR